MGKLDSRVAIVSGASRGIGRDIAVVFAREGARVVVAARTEREGDYRISGSIDTTVERIRSEGGVAIGVRCDVTKDEEIEDLVKRTMDEYGRVDILVNNAAIYTPGTVLEVQPRHWDLSYRINIRGPFMTCRAVLPHMIEQGGGHIINISGSASKGPGSGPYDDVTTSTYPGFTVGGVSKAALDRLTQGFAHEAFRLNIAVNGLLPARSIASEGTAYHSGGAEAMHGAYVDGENHGGRCGRHLREGASHLYRQHRHGRGDAPERGHRHLRLSARSLRRRIRSNTKRGAGPHQRAGAVVLQGRGVAPLG